MSVFKKAVSVSLWTQKPVTMKSLNLDAILTSPYAYEQGLVKAIDEAGRQHTLNNAGEYYKHAQLKSTIKIEGIERLNKTLFEMVNRAARSVLHDGPVSCHCFIAKQGSPSFPEHQDPDAVMLYVIEGTKVLNAHGEQYFIRAGGIVTMAPNVPHRAENRDASVMLSIGFEKYISEKLNA